MSTTTSLPNDVQPSPEATMFFDDTEGAQLRPSARWVDINAIFEDPLGMIPRVLAGQINTNGTNLGWTTEDSDLDVSIFGGTDAVVTVTTADPDLVAALMELVLDWSVSSEEE